jgi:5-formyltetrahydrofolate cyclo-ligase
MVKPSNSRELRKAIRAARRAVADPLRETWNDQICARILETPEYRASRKVAGFLAFDGEADPRGVMNQAIKDGKQVFVPLMQGKHDPLLFVEWFPDAKLEKNRFGIDEPIGDKDAAVAANTLELVVTPLVAFDENCNRVGVGGGFYDRTFEFVKPKSDGRSCDSGVAMIGFTFELQKQKLIHPNPWDIRLSAVATERMIYRPPDVVTSL